MRVIDIKLNARQPPSSRKITDRFLRGNRWSRNWTANPTTSPILFRTWNLDLIFAVHSWIKSLPILQPAQSTWIWSITLHHDIPHPYMCEQHELRMSEIPHLTLGLEELTQPIKTLIRHVHTSFVRLDCAKREVHGRNGELSESVEQCWFPNIWKSDLHTRSQFSVPTYTDL